MILRAVAMAACLVGAGTSACAYEYLDSRGYRHWCQLSCEQMGIHVPKAGEDKSPGVGPRQGKVVSEDDLAWEPPPGVKWQVVPESPSRARVNLFTPGAVAKDDTRP
jgi:hypothetical protein